MLTANVKYKQIDIISLFAGYSILPSLAAECHFHFTQGLINIDFTSQHRDETITYAWLIDPHLLPPIPTTPTIHVIKFCCFCATRTLRSRSKTSPRAVSEGIGYKEKLCTSPKPAPGHSELSQPSCSCVPGFLICPASSFSQLNWRQGLNDLELRDAGGWETRRELKMEAEKPTGELNQGVGEKGQTTTEENPELGSQCLP